MSKIIGVLSNGGNAQKRRAAAGLDLYFSQHPNIVHITTQGEAEVPAALEKLAASGAQVLAINGGDGTVAHVLTSLINGGSFSTLPILAVLPGGTSNITAGDVGFRGSLRRAALKLCRWSSGTLKASTITRPALTVESSALPAPLHGLVFGAGVIVEGIDYWHEQIKSRGMRGPASSFVAMMGTLRGILGGQERFSESVPAQIACGESSTPRQIDILMILVCSLERLFLGVRPYWGNGEGLHCTIIRSQPDRLIRVLPSILRGRTHPLLSEEHGYMSQRSNRIELRLRGRFTLDGDLYNLGENQQSVLLRSGPELEFLRPD